MKLPVLCNIKRADMCTFILLPKYKTIKKLSYSIITGTRQFFIYNFSISLALPVITLTIGADAAMLFHEKVNSQKDPYNSAVRQAHPA